MRELKIAIVHEWLVDYSGSEKVLEQLIEVFPNCDLFAVVEFLPENLKFFIKNKPVKTTFIQKLPFAKKKYRSYLPFMPIAIEQVDVSEYDVVLCSSHAVSKGVITHVNQIQICYCHSPIRYAWDLYHQYLKESKLYKGIGGLFAKMILHYMRIWDYTTGNRVDYFVANSKYIAKRIQKTYNRTADVIYPPVDVERFLFSDKKEDFYLTASRFVPYKKMDLIVEAFSKMPDKKLFVIGDGPDQKKIASKASSNVTLLGYLPQKEMIEYFQKAKAFVFAADEDFGITTIEAQACGTPVIAFGRGGSLENVIEGTTGTFFYEQTTDSIIEAVNRFEKLPTMDYSLIRKHAEGYSIERFKNEIKEYVFSKVGR